MEKIQVSGNFALVDQICYDRVGEALAGDGTRRYQAVDAKEKRRRFLRVEDPDTDSEKWYSVVGAELEPVSLQGLEHLANNPR